MAGEVAPLNASPQEVGRQRRQGGPGQVRRRKRAIGKLFLGPVDHCQAPVQALGAFANFSHFDAAKGMK